MRYDQTIIYEFAERLYSHAARIVAIYTVMGVLLGAGAGSVVGNATGSQIGLLIGAIVGGGIGYMIGTEKAFWIKLQAQIALCQAQIEINTRLVPQANVRTGHSQSISPNPTEEEQPLIHDLFDQIDSETAT
jgi:hypothetical protein